MYVAERSAVAKVQCCEATVANQRPPYDEESRRADLNHDVVRGCEVMAASVPIHIVCLMDAANDISVALPPKRVVLLLA